MQTSAQLKKDLQKACNPKKAAFFPRFFKTGKGEYAEGDIFIGVTVPQIRNAIRPYRDLELKEIEKLLKDPIHECRLAALLILVWQYNHADDRKKKEIANFYMANITYVNNWDLVDASAPQILGEYLNGKSTEVLDRLARSTNLWKQRVAIVATQSLIRKGQFDDTVRIAQMLLDHPHDLIHKATGWMLREMGKQDRKELEKFLKEHAKTMPRTALRYALEHFDTAQRQRYMKR